MSAPVHAIHLNEVVYTGLGIVGYRVAAALAAIDGEGVAMGMTLEVERVVMGMAVPLADAQEDVAPEAWVVELDAALQQAEPVDDDA